MKEAVLMIIMTVIMMSAGGFMFLKPETIWKITESWRHYGNTEPSDLYILSVKLGGGFLLVFGIIGLVWYFIA